jgi:hypothetical protein
MRVKKTTNAADLTREWRFNGDISPPASCSFKPELS